jgi:para-aminobenzoate synthetase / 4-amino-4-deoxychorismate lyase
MEVTLQFEKKPLVFRNPEYIISCYDPARFAACFQDAERALDRGYYLAGFFSYEAGYCFEEKLRENRTYEFPLVYLGVYKAPQLYHPGRYIPPSRMVKRLVEHLRLNISRDNYFSHIRAIRGHIARGEVYQVTYCIKAKFSFCGDPHSLYHVLLREQPVPYPARVLTDRFHILSLSPEMFIKKNAGFAVTKPMKGTWPRGGNAVSDIVAGLRLQYDAKNRAENLMITDLLRNDLGRIGERIAVPRLFEVARYRTLFQMTSTVTAHMNKNVSLYELFSALFPSGSVTGAPKIAAMDIIRKLEGEERKIYTGAIGYITPGRDLFFNIPIRTLLIQGEEGEMGIGGGIVWDSTPQGEWDEGMLKGRFLTDLLTKSDYVVK